MFGALIPTMVPITDISLLPIAKTTVVLFFTQKLIASNTIFSPHVTNFGINC
jgi:hypothetical protein